MMTSAAVPSPSPARRSTRPRLGAIIAVGVAFAILQTCLIATFPLLEGTELRSRVQSAISSVSKTRLVRIVVSAFQPRIRRLKASMTNAT